MRVSSRVWLLMSFVVWAWPTKTEQEPFFLLLFVNSGDNNFLIIINNK